MSDRQIINPLPLVALFTAVLMLTTLVIAYPLGMDALAGYVLMLCVVLTVLTLPLLGFLRVLYTIRSARLRQTTLRQTQALIYQAMWDNPSVSRNQPHVIQFPVAQNQTTARH